MEEEPEWPRVLVQQLLQPVWHWKAGQGINQGGPEAEAGLNTVSVLSCPKNMCDVAVMTGPEEQECWWWTEHATKLTCKRSIGNAARAHFSEAPF